VAVLYADASVQAEFDNLHETDQPAAVTAWLLVVCAVSSSGCSGRAGHVILFVAFDAGT
jgi:hypothetical protein